MINYLYTTAPIKFVSHFFFFFCKNVIVPLHVSLGVVSVAERERESAAAVLLGLRRMRDSTAEDCGRVEERIILIPL